MKIVILVLLILISTNLLANSIYKEVVLGEIQATLIKDYGASKSFWGKSGSEYQKKSVTKKVIQRKVVKQDPVPMPVKKTPIVKRIKKPKIKPVKKVVKKIDNNSGMRGYKNSRKRKKRGLIDDGGFVKYKPKKYKKRARVTRSKKTTSVGRGGSKRPTGDWMKDKMSEHSAWQSATVKAIDKWAEEKKAMIKKWENDRKQYFKRLPTYKKNLVNIDSFASAGNISKNDQKLSVKFVGGGAVTVPGAFDNEVKDQGKRPTCSAFASTRAMEIALGQSGNRDRLSDQYVYFASKPKCQSSPCSKRGSWGLKALQKSARSSSPDIPTEKSCPYSKSQMNGNETQIPLKSGCYRGEHKVTKYHQVKSLTEIRKALDGGSPVISGFKLSPNFYKNSGVILYKESKGVSKKAHGAGHAILLVGYMKIPPKLNEGKVCFITANSWGIGWGKGGHACLSEKWVNNYRFNISFLAVDSVI